MPQRSAVDVVEREFPRAARLFEVWAQYIYESVIDFGWNVNPDRAEGAGIRGNTEHRDVLFEEVSRLRMRQRSDHSVAINVHCAWRMLPRPWRRAVWAIYIDMAREASTLAVVMGVKRQAVPTHLRGAYAEALDLLPRVVPSRAA